MADSHQTQPRDEQGQPTNAVMGLRGADAEQLQREAGAVVFEGNCSTCHGATAVYIQDGASETLALQSGRADAYFGPHVLGAWKAAKSGNERLVGSVDGGWPASAHIAVTLKKGSGLTKAIQTALNGVIANGDYQKVLNRWGEGLEAIPAAEINPPGLGD